MAVNGFFLTFPIVSFLFIYLTHPFGYCVSRTPSTRRRCAPSSTHFSKKAESIILSLCLFLLALFYSLFSSLTFRRFRQVAFERRRSRSFYPASVPTFLNSVDIQRLLAFASTDSRFKQQRPPSSRLLAQNVMIQCFLFNLAFSQ